MTPQDAHCPPGGAGNGAQHEAAAKHEATLPCDEATDNHDIEVVSEEILLDAALDLAARGVHVFPVGNQRQPLTEHGWHDATDDPTKIAQMPWQRASGVAIALALSGLCAIDADRHGDGIDGVENLRHLVQQHGQLPETWSQRTPRDGTHHIYLLPDGLENARKHIAPGVELLRNAYVVVAPSVTEYGQYEWTRSPGECEVADLPAWVGKVAARSRAPTPPPDSRTAPVRLDPYLSAALDGEAQRLRAAPAGQRNEQLNRSAFALGQLAHVGLREDEAWTALWDACLANGLAEDRDNGGERRCRRTFESGWQSGCAQPRAPATASTSAEPDLRVTKPMRGPDSASEQSPYPIDALPDPVASFVRMSAEAIGCPPAMVALPLLANAGACLGNRVTIRLKRGFEESPILWTAVVAPPGAAKSPAHDAASSAIHRLQSEAKRRYDDACAEYERDVIAWQAQKPDERGPRPVEPALEHFFTTDSTVEQLAHIVASSPGVVLTRDELVGWVESFDAYSRSGGRQAMLSAWSGKMLKVDRRTRGGCAYAERPVACVTGGIQPDMLPALAADAGRDDGFVQRFLWAMPDVRAAGWSEDEVSTELRDELYSVFHGLRYASVSEEPVVLSPEAKQVWVTWYDEAMASVEAATGLAAGMAAKLPNQVARLALVLHALEDPQNINRPLSVETMESAIVLGEWHREQAARVLPRIGESDVGPGAPLVLRVERILVAADGEWVTKTQLHQRLGGHVSAKALDVALATLLEAGRAETMIAEAGLRGGRPAERWRVPRERTELSEGTGHGLVDSDSSVRSQDVSTGAVGASDVAEGPDVPPELAPLIAAAKELDPDVEYRVVPDTKPLEGAASVLPPDHPALTGQPAPQPSEDKDQDADDRS